MHGGLICVVGIAERYNWQPASTGLPPFQTEARLAVHVS